MGAGLGEHPQGAPLQQDALAKARTAYQDFLTLWKDADPDIPILKEAKAEYAGSMIGDLHEYGCRFISAAGRTATAHLYGPPFAYGAAGRAAELEGQRTGAPPAGGRALEGSN